MTQTDKQTPITDVKALSSGLEDGKAFEVEIEGQSFTFRPVKRCPATSRDTYGRHNKCSGVWYDYGPPGPDAVQYRFCPKVPEALAALTDHLWRDIIRQAEWTKQRRERRDADQAVNRRRAAEAKACEGLNTDALEAGVVADMLAALESFSRLQFPDYDGELVDTAKAFVATYGRALTHEGVAFPPALC